MPSAPPIKRIETVVVPSVSNLAKPYGYLAEGGFLDNFQQNKVTKSPNRSYEVAMSRAYVSGHDEHAPLKE